MFSAAMQPSSRSPDISAEPPEQWLYGSTASSSMTAWPVVAVTRPGNTFTLEQFFSPGETMSQFLDVIGDGPLLQLFCLLLGGDGTVKLSAGSRALHRHATCDDVCRVVIYGSPLANSFASLDPSISVAEDSMPTTLIT